jgi:hypothetical protein
MAASPEDNPDAEQFRRNRARLMFLPDRGRPKRAPLAWHLVIPGLIVGGAGAWIATDPAGPLAGLHGGSALAATNSASAASVSSVHFHDCREAWERGAAPIKAGEPGYETRLDADGDGVACEPLYR